MASKQGVRETKSLLRFSCPTLNNEPPSHEHNRHDKGNSREENQVEKTQQELTLQFAHGQSPHQGDKVCEGKNLGQNLSPAR